MGKSERRVDTGAVSGADHTATKERRADRAARAWRSTARLPPGGVDDPAKPRMMGAPAGRTSPRDVPKRLDPFRPERNRGHRHRPGRRSHHCWSARFARGIGFSQSTPLVYVHDPALRAPGPGLLRSQGVRDGRGGPYSPDWERGRFCALWLSTWAENGQRAGIHRRTRCS